ncbi:hypothetical protein [Coleofasciculus sp. E2-BRE-01]|uniref:hypothetical protein n=1 Tax=Coleofasciculus sp. E2-BRE-01 TaxID=3069524 RepID=UPI003302A43B
MPSKVVKGQKPVLERSEGTGDWLSFCYLLVTIEVDDPITGLVLTKPLPGLSLTR